jgi:hypothetical protein
MAENKDIRIAVGALLVAVASLVVCSLTLYVNLLHEKEHEGADYMPVILSIVLFVISVGLVGWAVYWNLKDARRAKSLLAQIVTIKEDHRINVEVLKD